jgi:gas vesicle protein
MLNETKEMMQDLNNNIQLQTVEKIDDLKNDIQDQLAILKEQVNSTTTAVKDELSNVSSMIERTLNG